MTATQVEPVERPEAQEDGLGSLFRLLTTAGVAVIACALVLFYALVLRARLELGFWPYPRHGNPLAGTYTPSPLDPKNLGFQYVVTWYALSAAVIASGSTALLLVIGAPFRSFRRSPAFLAAFVAVAALFLLQMALDPGSFFLWFVD